MRIQKLLDGDNLYISKRIRFTPARSWSIVYDNEGRRIIVAQTYFEHWNSKRKNTRIFHKKYGWGEGKCVLVDCECKEVW